MKPTVRVESLGSMWLIDEIDMVYMRLPKGEGPRKSPDGADWTGPGAGILQDYVWHPFESWAIEEHHCWIGKHADGTLIEIDDHPVLVIRRPDYRVLSAPDARVIA